MRTQLRRCQPEQAAYETMKKEHAELAKATAWPRARAERGEPLISRSTFAAIPRSPAICRAAIPCASWPATIRRSSHKAAAAGTRRRDRRPEEPADGQSVCQSHLAGALVVASSAPEQLRQPGERAKHPRCSTGSRPRSWRPASRNCIGRSHIGNLSPGVCEETADEGIGADNRCLWRAGRRRSQSKPGAMRCSQ